MTDLATYRQQHPDLDAMTCAEIDVEAALCMGRAWLVLSPKGAWAHKWRPTTNAAQSQELAAHTAKVTLRAVVSYQRPVGSGLVCVWTDEFERDNINEATARACIQALRRHGEKA